MITGIKSFRLLKAGARDFVVWDKNYIEDLRTLQDIPVVLIVGVSSVFVGFCC